MFAQQFSPDTIYLQEQLEQNKKQYEQLQQTKERRIRETSKERRRDSSKLSVQKLLQDYQRHTVSTNNISVSKQLASSFFSSHPPTAMKPSAHSRFFSTDQAPKQSFEQPAKQSFEQQAVSEIKDASDLEDSFTTKIYEETRKLQKNPVDLERIENSLSKIRPFFTNRADQGGEDRQPYQSNTTDEPIKIQSIYNSQSKGQRISSRHISIYKSPSDKENVKPTNVSECQLVGLNMMRDVATFFQGSQRSSQKKELPPRHKACDSLIKYPRNIYTYTQLHEKKRQLSLLG